MQVDIGIYPPSSPEGLAYRAHPSANYSALKYLDVSPLHYEHARTKGFPTTRAMTHGVATHLAILEPELLSGAVAIFDGERRAGSEWKAFEAANQGKIILKRSEYEGDKVPGVLAMATAVRKHPVASKYLGGHREMSMFWQDVWTDEPCKGRPDLVCGDTLVDLKTTADASAAGFSRTCARLLYHAQAAFYSDGYERITGIAPKYVYIVVEAKAPHDVVVYEADPGMVGYGRDLYVTWLKRLQECRASNVWPGRAPDAPVPLQLPVWAMPGEDDDLTELGLE